MLVALLVVGLAIATGVAAFYGVLSSRSKAAYDARLEIVPGVRSRAPEEWAGSHSFEAKLHRRLGDAVRAVHHQPTLGGPNFTIQRSALEQEALRIGDRLVAAAALPERRRRPALDGVARLVDSYEDAVSDLITTTLSDENALDVVIHESEIRLQALEAARAEVERADRGQQG